MPWKAHWIVLLSALALTGCGGVFDPPQVRSPSAKLSVVVTNAAPEAGQQLKVEVSAGLIPSAPAGSTITQIQWNFGDGSAPELVTDKAQFNSPRFHAFPSAGNYTITVTATDNTGQSVSLVRAVTVKVTAATGRLNDTGQTWCSYNNGTSVWTGNLVCSLQSWVGQLWGELQDAYFGRDAANPASLNKVGAGRAGFDYTRLGAQGLPLLIQNAAWNDIGTYDAGSRWDCVRDNHTGLVWEVKRTGTANASDLRYNRHLYAWYQPDAALNGGNAGTSTTPAFTAAGTAIPAGTACTGLASCNTLAYVTAINTLLAEQQVCGYSDWRMPSFDELQTLVSLASTIGTQPTIEADFFPDVRPDTSGQTWTSDTLVSNNTVAWSVAFMNGTDNPLLGTSDSTGTNNRKVRGMSVRLVRTGKTGS